MEEKPLQAAFFHDTPLVKDGGAYYSITFPYSLWEDRYLSVFERLLVSTRCRDRASGHQFALAQQRGLMLSSGDKVQILPITAYTNQKDILLHFRKIKTQVRHTLAMADCAIVRLPSVIGFFACREAIKMGKPWAVESVACPFDSYWNQGPFAGKILAPFMYLCNRHYIGKSHFTLYVTHRFLQGRYPSRGVQQIASNVYVEPIALSVLEQRTQKIQSMRNSLTFGLIGSLDVDFKGHKVALRALARIQDQLPSFTLKFLGPGNSERFAPLIRSLHLEAHVEFCGSLPSGQPVMEWLDSLDIFLIPSLQEGLPRALIEAMSRGCPALGARTGGIPELLPEEFLHDKRNDKQLAKSILRLAEDKTLMMKAAIRNVQTADEYTRDKLDRRRRDFWQHFARTSEVRQHEN